MAEEQNASALIHVETFEVGLGASMLMQFRTPQGVVRVLADGGVHSNPDDHVLRKLPKAIDSFGESGRHIDLVIGTHYDADHLRGLVPIIEDGAFSFGEAWLPPVANDEQPPLGTDPDESNMLALQFASDRGDAILASYIAAKAGLCSRLHHAEMVTDELREIERRIRFGDQDLETIRSGDASERTVLAFFGDHILSAHETLGTAPDEHADLPVAAPLAVEDIYDDEESSFPLHRFIGRPRSDTLAALVASWRDRAEHAEKEAMGLAFIRKSAARQAITASHLARVVKALKARQVKIRCSTIPAGQPRRFVWDAADGRFIPSARKIGAVEVTLLGPSVGLVKRHCDRLPIGQYIMYNVRRPLPIAHTTPSNQLSYVTRFSYAGQNILVSGDTGFSDFREQITGSYFEQLLEKLVPLHVIQVAHHGGANGYFYHALIEAGLADQKPAAMLVISHGVRDEKRPSSAFGFFIERIRREADDFQLFFTSQPLDKWVRDFRSMIAPPTVSPPRDRGDVRMVYDGVGWEVQQNLVAAEAA